MHVVYCDLSEANASIDWADRQIDLLSAQISCLAQENPHTFTKARQPNEHLLFYVEINKKALDMISGDVNSIIQAQRSSLDYLAVALAKRNKASVLTDVYFPIVKTSDDLTKRQALDKIKRISHADQATIHSLKPYQGGNDALYGLHWLNIERKHRKLGAVGAVNSYRITGNAILRNVIFFQSVDLSKGRTPVADFDLSGDVNIDVALTTTFQEVAGEVNQPLIPTLRKFSNACRSIVGRF